MPIRSQFESEKEWLEHLRIWFAAQALAGFCSNTTIYWTKPGVGKHIAEECWKQADAMLAVREVKS